jgi:hypothetical protein
VGVGRVACGFALQFFHVFAVRSRFDSLFSKNPFRNVHMNVGVLLEVSAGALRL